MEKEVEMRVLSLFDGMACGMVAFLRAGLPISSYHAYEIDKYAIITTSHNFPSIVHHGDVFGADFTQYEGFDFLIGGSPCTYWSIAQSPDKRETTASGMGWELFSQYVRALREAKPKFFIYENNKSMARAIYESISEAFGFEPIMINSALVSAQNRQRYYWIGRRNEDGSYSKVDVSQPEDRGILLKDVLDGVTDRDKARAVIGSSGRTTEREYFQKAQGNMTYEPVNTTISKKSYTIKAQYAKTSIANLYSSKYGASGVAEPVCIASRGRYVDTDSRSVKADCGTYQHLEAGEDSKTNALTTVSKDNLISEPIRCFTLPRKDGVQTESKQYRVYETEGKSTTLCAEGGGMGAKTGLYAVPVEVDENGEPTKAVFCTDGKTYTVYKIKQGLITIKEKTYPIKLFVDGYYIIRKLTVSECKRLQTVPEWYEFPVSDTQAYKMLGNGWTVEVIAHIIKEIMLADGVE